MSIVSAASADAGVHSARAPLEGAVHPGLNTGAPRRQARAAAARLWLACTSDPARAGAGLQWHELLALPAWVPEMQTRPSGLWHARLALAAGSLWHAPALRRSLDASVLQRLAEEVGAPVLKRLLEVDDCGPAQALPAENAGLVPALRHTGQLLMLAAQPECWRGALAQAWGWEPVACELTTLPASERGGQRAFQRAERVCAAAWGVVAAASSASDGVPTDAPASAGRGAPPPGDSSP